MPVLASQSVLSQVAWTMGSPSIVLPFLAVSLEMPMFLAGALVSVRQAGNMISDMFFAIPVSAKQQKKRSIALTEVAIGACLLAAIVVAAIGGSPMVAAAFVLAFFAIGMIEEVQALMFTDLWGDHLRSKSRIWMSYLQLGAGGARGYRPDIDAASSDFGQPAILASLDRDRGVCRVLCAVRTIHSCPGRTVAVATPASNRSPSGGAVPVGRSSHVRIRLVPAVFDHAAAAGRGFSVGAVLCIDRSRGASWIGQGADGVDHFVGDRLSGRRAPVAAREHEITPGGHGGRVVDGGGDGRRSGCGSLFAS